LVNTTDKLLKILESNPDYKAFSFDGQTSVLEDYLEVRPEKEADLKKAVKSGRLAVGPWYVLSDMYLVSGESLIRNLMTGRRIAKRFGRVMNAGYVPDPFGHPATMPSILAGFGLDNYIYMRGAPKEVYKLGIVIKWVAPDGASVMAIRQVSGYGSLCAWGVKEGRAVDDSDSDHGERAWGRVRGEIDGMKKNNLNVSVLLFNNGVDHFPAQPTIPDLIRSTNRKVPEVLLKQGTFEDYVNALRSTRPRLKSFSGELHSGYMSHILSGVFSARMWIKQQNFECQRLLERVAEPLDAFVGRGAGVDLSGSLRYAWKTLLKNHPHDDICGCSVDETHDDNACNFRQSRQATTGVVYRLSEELGRDLPIGEEDKPRDFIVGYNPEPYERGCEMNVIIRNSSLKEPGPWRLRRGDGRLVPAVFSGECNTWEGGSLKFFDEAMPACGYAAYVFEKGKPTGPPRELKAKGGTIENAILKATLNPNGTVDLVEKDTRRRFRGLNLFEDTEDCGDEYDYSPLRKNSKTLTFEKTKGRVGKARVSVGAAEVTAKVVLRIPRSLSSDRRSRSRQIVSVPVSVTICLRPGLRRLEFKTTVDNRAEDHRLRAWFPTRVIARKVLASTHFAVIERPVDPSKGTDKDDQATSPTQHMDELVAVQSKGRGCTVVTKGLPEYEGREERDGVALGITLLRCVGWLSRDDLATRCCGAGPSLSTPGGQCPGRHVFEYAFLPYSGELVSSGAAVCAMGFTVPPLAAHVSLRGMGPDRTRPRTAAMLKSWLSIDRPEVMLSSIKRCENGSGYAVRVYNLSSKRVTATLTFGERLRSARLARLDETPIRKLKVSGNSLVLNMKPREIATALLS
jgi:alpha-mannosidase